jgi:hypothetical protein
MKVDSEPSTAKRTRLEAVPEAEAGLQAVQHPSHLKVTLHPFVINEALPVVACEIVSSCTCCDCGDWPVRMLFLLGREYQLMPKSTSIILQSSSSLVNIQLGKRRNHCNVLLYMAQVAGEVFVIGDGDCGQLGKGEDVCEASRPSPSPILDRQVWTALPSILSLLACDQVWPTL